MVWVNGRKHGGSDCDTRNQTHGLPELVRIDVRSYTGLD
jgi:hypothetical protein